MNKNEEKKLESLAKTFIGNAAKAIKEKASVSMNSDDEPVELYSLQFQTKEGSVTFRVEKCLDSKARDSYANWGETYCTKSIFITAQVDGNDKIYTSSGTFSTDGKGEHRVVSFEVKGLTTEEGVLFELRKLIRRILGDYQSSDFFIFLRGVFDKASAPLPVTNMDEEQKKSINAALKTQKRSRKVYELENKTEEKPANSNSKTVGKLKIKAGKLKAKKAEKESKSVIDQIMKEPQPEIIGEMFKKNLEVLDRENQDDEDEIEKRLVLRDAINASINTATLIDDSDKGCYMIPKNSFLGRLITSIVKELNDETEKVEDNEISELNSVFENNLVVEGTRRKVNALLKYETERETSGQNEKERNGRYNMYFNKENPCQR